MLSFNLVLLRLIRILSDFGEWEMETATCIEMVSNYFQTTL